MIELIGVAIATILILVVVTPFVIALDKARKEMREDDDDVLD